jgi:hypothetical protein
VGLVSGARRSPLLFIVPGVLILVPGSAGFNSLLKLLTGQTVSGIDAGFNTFVTAMSIAYGLMLSTVILPRRFTAIGLTRSSRRVIRPESRSSFEQECGSIRGIGTSWSSVCRRALAAQYRPADVTKGFVAQREASHGGENTDGRLDRFRLDHDDHDRRDRFL